MHKENLQAIESTWRSLKFLVDRTDFKAKAKIELIDISKISHYLKVLQRENIGSNKTRNALEDELTIWINTLVTEITAVRLNE